MVETLHILVIEDHMEMAAALCRLITQKISFAQCRMAHTFADGMRMAHETRADITILDIHLPDATLDEVVTSIPKIPRPVIVVTEMDDPEEILMNYCYAYNADNFYLKRNLLKIITSWDAEMTARQLVSSIASAHFRHVMPEKKHLFVGGVAHLFIDEITRLDEELKKSNGNHEAQSVPAAGATC